jgi:hypothetical protein
MFGRRREYNVLLQLKRGYNPIKSKENFIGWLAVRTCSVSEAIFIIFLYLCTSKFESEVAKKLTARKLKANFRLRIIENRVCKKIMGNCPRNFRTIFLYSRITMI